MNRIILGTAVALSLAAPAFASNTLAAQLGVTPGEYTTAELIQLQNAYEENDEIRIDFILNGTDNGAGDVTAIQLARAIADDDVITEAFLRNGGSEVVSTQSFGTSAGAANLAGSIGVNPADYGVAELINLRSAIEDDDQLRIGQLLKN